MYSHGQELFYKFTNKLVKQLLSMTVSTTEVTVMLSNKDISNEKYVNEIRLKVCVQRMLG